MDWGHIGLNAGYDWSGGVQAGYNHRINNIVFGIETDFAFANHTKSASTINRQSIYRNPNYEYHLTEELYATNKVAWFGTVRPRLGIMPTNRWLVYATGGLAYGKVKTSGGYQWREHGFWWGGPGDHFFDRSDGFTKS